jgi:hypothetical protein
MADGVLKADRDFTKETDAAIPEAQSLAKVNTLSMYLDEYGSCSAD